MNDAMIKLPSKEDIQSTIQTIASKLKFNPDCSSNKQSDKEQPKIRLRLQDQLYNKLLSTAQIFTICNLRINNVSDEEIATKMNKTVDEVKNVVCPDGSRERFREEL